MQYSRFGIPHLDPGKYPLPYTTYNTEDEFLQIEMEDVLQWKQTFGEMI